MSARRQASPGGWSASQPDLAQAEMLSLRQVPSINGQNRTCYERGLVRGEEEDGVRHLRRFAEPPYRVCFPHRGYVFLGQFYDGLGRYGAWRHSIDADAPLCPLDRQVLGDP